MRPPSTRWRRSRRTLVILDLSLPDIDGVVVCRRLREWTQLPVIILSANGEDEAKVRALDEGADDYVTKPFSVPELLARMRVAVRRAARDRPSRRSVIRAGTSRSTWPAGRCCAAARKST